MQQMSEKTLFTIIMCTYNSAITLDMAVESVLKQSFSGWEMLILDNGSADGSVAALKEYEKKDGRIHCLFLEENVGWCKGISICLKQAQGKYMMFLGADDYLATEHTLQEVAAEIERYKPQIVWTGCGFAVFENGKHEIVTSIEPEHKVYQKEDKLTQFYELMKSVYYNSVMHYVEIDFLKRIGVDFYSPFYGDCEGMTEAIARAEKMVTMDKIEYILTANTSQTAKKATYERNVENQWKSVKSVLPGLKRDFRSEFIAQRILNNLVANIQGIVLLEPVRDNDMNEIHRSLSERFLKAEELISTDAIGEMICIAGREEFTECLIGAAGINYWTCRKNETLTKQIWSQSKWLARFVEITMEMDESGKIQWKKQFTLEEGRQLQQLLQNEDNRYRLGLELLLKPEVVFEDEKVKELLQIWQEKIQKQY